MENFKTFVYAAACLLFGIVIGASVYEHICVVPQWSAAPPASLSMFQGPYGIRPGPFWKMIHPFTLVFLIASLILFWKTAARKNILIALVGYALILVATAIYFVPELMRIFGTTYTNSVNEALKNSAQTWQKLSLIRMTVGLLLAIILLTGLARSGKSVAGK